MRNQQSKAPSETSSTLMARREFIALGSAALATAAVAASVSGEARKVLAFDEPAPVLSVGYAEATLEDFAKPGFAVRLMDATTIGSGDKAISDYVSVRILGLIRPAEAGSAGINLAVDAMYRLPGQAHEAPFMAWSYSRMPRRAELTSASAPFLVPVAANHPLTLAFSTMSASSGKMLSCGSVKLALGNGRNESRLRQGLYFVALTPAGSREPDWAGIEAVSTEEGNLPAVRQSGASAQSQAPFDFVLVATESV